MQNHKTTIAGIAAGFAAVLCFSKGLINHMKTLQALTLAFWILACPLFASATIDPFFNDKPALHASDLSSLSAYPSAHPGYVVEVDNAGGGIRAWYSAVPPGTYVVASPHVITGVNVLWIDDVTRIGAIPVAWSQLTGIPPSVSGLPSASMITANDNTTIYPGSFLLGVNQLLGGGLVIDYPNDGEISIEAPFGDITGTYAEGNDSRFTQINGSTAPAPPSGGDVGQLVYVCPLPFGAAGYCRGRPGDIGGILTPTKADTSVEVKTNIYDVDGLRKWDTERLWAYPGSFTDIGIYFACALWSGCVDNFYLTHLPNTEIEVETMAASPGSGNVGCRQKFYGAAVWTTVDPGWSMSGPTVENLVERSLGCPPVSAAELVTASITILSNHTISVALTYGGTGMVTARVRVLGSGTHS